MEPKLLIIPVSSARKLPPDCVMEPPLLLLIAPLFWAEKNPPDCVIIPPLLLLI